MGKLLSLLKPEEGGPSTDIFVDFENAQPTEAEKKVFQHISTILEPSSALLSQLKSYTGCGNIVAGKTDGRGRVVCPAVGQLKQFYDFGPVLEEAFCRLLRYFCSSDTQSLEKLLESSQATVGLLARLLVFALEFDDMKVTNPSIQNDFSYYRRTLSRLKMSATSTGSFATSPTSPTSGTSALKAKEMLEKAQVKDELANKMSFFYADPTPMLKVLLQGLEKIIKTPNVGGTGPALQQPVVVACLSIMASVCHVAVSQNKFSKPDTMYFCLRVMVVSIILYDHIHPDGAFKKTGEIPMKQHIRLIQTSAGPHTEPLLNALRYTTKHLNDEATPKSIKTLLG